MLVNRKSEYMRPKTPWKSRTQVQLANTAPTTPVTRSVSLAPSPAIAGTLATAKKSETARSAVSPPPRCTTAHASRKWSGAPPRTATTVCSTCGNELRPTKSASASSSCGGHMRR